jgi:hypothetical protein
MKNHKKVTFKGHIVVVILTVGWSICLITVFKVFFLME